MELVRPMYQVLKGLEGRMSLHMPGAKGKSPFGITDMYAMDTTELPITDDLYTPTGPVLQAQHLAAKSAGANHTIFLTGGSTAGVLTMLMTAASPGDQVILPRNAHLSAIHGCVLGDLHPVFARPKVTADGYAYVPEASFLEAISENPKAKAVLVTRPDFYGGAVSLKRIAEACQKCGMALLVDEAHGAHFNWMAGWENAISQGADMAVQSAHKTLPCLTAGAYLHFSKPNEKALGVLRMVQTSSPPFYLLMSLDDARAWMDGYGKEKLKDLAVALDGLRKKLPSLGFEDAYDLWKSEGISLDPTRLVIGAPQGGEMLAKQLENQGIDVEMYDQRRVVCIFSIMDGQAQVDKLLAALGNCPCNEGIAPDESFPLPQGEQVCSPRQAFFQEKELVPLSQAVDRIAGVAAGLYPPGIPLVMPGEKITTPVLELLRGAQPNHRFGITEESILCVSVEIERKDS